MATLDRAIKFDPTNGQALANKGEVLCELGNFEEAGAALDQAIGLDPSYTHADASVTVSAAADLRLDGLARAIESGGGSTRDRL